MNDALILKKASKKIRCVYISSGKQMKYQIGIKQSFQSLVIENIEYLKWLSQNKVDLVYGNTNEVSK